MAVPRCRECVVCGETKDVWNFKGITPLCKTHYRRAYNGKDPFKRTMDDKNEVVVCKDYAEIYLYNIKGDQIASTKIDTSDVECVKNYKWHLDKKGYASCTALGKRLHNFLMNTPRGYVTDHINQNKLDNTRKNLRICTNSRNLINNKKRGISFHKKINRWRARITVDGKEIYLGNFIFEKDALKARAKAVQKYLSEPLRERR